MKSNKFFLILFFYLLTFISETFSVGETSMNFLKIGIGAGPIAMGSANAALVKDVTSLYWNPAGLGFLQGKEIFAQHTGWFQGINYECMSLGMNMGSVGSIGFSGSFLSTGLIEKRDISGNLIGSYDGKDTLFQIGYGKDLTDIALGCSVKYISEEIDGVKSSPVLAADFGAILYTKKSPYSVAVVYQNVGTVVKFINETKGLPENFKLGFGYHPDKKYNLGVDANFPNDNKFNIGAGMEYKLYFMNDFYMPIRIGYKTANDLGMTAGLSFGAGFNLSGDVLDFAWVPYGDLGDTYRISLKFSIGKRPQPDLQKKTEKKQPKAIQKNTKKKQTEKNKKIIN